MIAIWAGVIACGDGVTMAIDEDFNMGCFAMCHHVASNIAEARQSQKRNERQHRDHGDVLGQ